MRYIEGTNIPLRRLSLEEQNFFLDFIQWMKETGNDEVLREQGRKMADEEIARRRKEFEQVNHLKSGAAPGKSSRRRTRKIGTERRKSNGRTRRIS